MTVFVNHRDGWSCVCYISDCHSIWKKGTEYAIADDSAIDRFDEHHGPEYTDDGVLYIDRKKSIQIFDGHISIPLFRKVDDFEKKEPTSSL